VPLSIAIRAPLETGTHSTGKPSCSARSMAATIRSHSGAARAPMSRVGSDRMSTRRMPSGTLGVGVLISEEFERFVPGTLVSVGRHSFRGVAADREIFTLPELLAAPAE